jgi:hypothetical protein
MGYFRRCNAYQGGVHGGEEEMRIQFAKLINQLLDQWNLMKLSTGKLTVTLHIHFPIKILAWFKML